ncbi:MAG: 2-phosphosulfolactate phosphatase [Thermotogaceae bacterium]|jgi:2-phosphosulfolactate phosphatase|nr:2-phosphosulfolactate phosphatase [Thermotogaceae bacterium]MDN5337754.1 2-phosphosulfolactate phosphatase [Thermotogaceae bacterium]
MKIKTKVIYYEKEKNPDTNYTTVIVDILRASSSITTLLSNGALWVKPVMSIEEAFNIKEKSPDVLLAGEKNALKIEGFDFGNSPTEFLNNDFKGKKIVLTTTNGTKAVLNHRDNFEVLIGCFLNINALIDYLKIRENILLVCSGSHGEFSLEDFLFCGRLIVNLTKNCNVESMDDASKLALKAAQLLGNELLPYAKESMHAKVLVSKGFEKDVDFCLKENVFSTIPILTDEGFKTLN